MTHRIVFTKSVTLLLLAIAPLAEHPQPARADDSAASKLSPEDQQALEVGRHILAVRKALRNYESPDSLKAITEAGTITANYVCIRGWLNEELRTATHMLDIQKGKPHDELEKKVAFLKRAIRAIDLE